MKKLTQVVDNHQYHRPNYPSLRILNIILLPKLLRSYAATPLRATLLFAFPKGLAGIWNGLFGRDRGLRDRDGENGWRGRRDVVTGRTGRRHPPSSMKIAHGVSLYSCCFMTYCYYLPSDDVQGIVHSEWKCLFLYISLGRDVGPRAKKEPQNKAKRGTLISERAHPLHPYHRPPQCTYLPIIDGVPANAEEPRAKGCAKWLAHCGADAIKLYQRFIWVVALQKSRHTDTSDIKGY